MHQVTNGVVPYGATWRARWPPATRGHRVSALEEGPPPPTLAPASRTMRSQVVAVSSLCGLRHEPRKVMARKTEQPAAHLIVLPNRYSVVPSF